jgi:hypothetical protein
MKKNLTGFKQNYLDRKETFHLYIDNSVFINERYLLVNQPAIKKQLY